ncbi:hypothetical protein CSOJ01_08689 [Colletotrichum sojae]|uniref:SMP-30/Gluconolactonase/LRE-like region domain-containing protein n=1 Tax=Colletotrichum sojae TaxID=2175907 RepID=A0A8H6J5D7_9PEZI|nr:hypothetical protein CSOJ01_08689 [Colletotrichum sojae]
MFVGQSFLQAFALLAAALLPTACPLPFDSCENETSSSVTTVHTVPEAASLENIAIRSSGDILVTSVASPTLFQLSPTNGYAPISVAIIDEVAGLLGIVELEQDLFYVVGSDLTSTENSNGIWKIDLRTFETSRNGTVIRPAAVSLVQRVPSARQLNGMTQLAANDTKTLLISDSGLGTVIRLDVDSGIFETVLQEPEMAPLATGLNIGVNGIRTRETDLFFVGLDQGIFAKIPISLGNGTGTGPVDILASDITFGDDFTLSKDGKLAYVATNGPQEALGIDAIRGGKNVLAASALLSSSSSVALDRFRPESTLYVTGAISVGNGTVGHVARIDIRCAAQT